MVHIFVILHIDHSDPCYRELAALIGQVKPPTATPEDIEKSGLQIIKSTDIPQYAVECKVASNCIDRVSLDLPTPVLPANLLPVHDMSGRL